jgi:hypothetical protein
MESQPDRELEAVEAKLRAQRPLPDQRFVEQLERRLLARRSKPRQRPLLAGLAATGALAATLLGLALVGAGPLAPSDQSSRASQRCHYVRVERRVREPIVVTRPDGTNALRLRSRSIERRVRRCR